MINLLLTLNIMFCDIKGSINNPGIYQIKNNNIYEVINLAGGLKKDANISNINLSKKVIDEMVIYIPSLKEKPKVCPPCKIKECSEEFNKTTTTKKYPTTTYTTTRITATIPTTILNRIININLASKEELMILNGIGEVVAKSIIEYRQNKLFENIEEIKNIKGIGEAVFVKIKDNITI